MSSTIHMTEVPAKQIPPWRYRIADKDGVKQIMMTTWGGAGDQACAEPTLRYAFKLFPGYEISLLTSFPEFFTHLPFKNVYTKNNIDWLSKVEDEWLIIHTNSPDANMSRDFIVHHYTQVVDFSSLVAFQRQLPIADRHVQFWGEPVGPNIPMVTIHPGKHWSSKTFPKQWWDEIIIETAKLLPEGALAIIGKDIDANTGTVDVHIPPGVRDLRNKLSWKQSITICKRTHVILTNDSAPLHIAAAGDAEILFVASCKEADHLLHWRNGEFGWKMRNLGLDGLWNHQSSCPIRPEPLTIEHMDQRLIEKLLPTPKSVVSQIWAAL